jgi:hypothetical protein
MADPTQLSPQQIINIGILTGTSTMIAAIVRILEEKGIVSPGEFSKVLEDTVSQTEKKNIMGQVQRYDLMMFRGIVEALRRPGKGWKPIVIQGGLADNEHPPE